MKLYTYYTYVPNINPADELRLLNLWRRHHSAVWEPFVLTEWHARQHPAFADFDARIRALPSVNPPEYERACYLRWLALAAVGGGFMSDYDVFQRPGSMLPELTGAGLGRLQMFQRQSPSLVYAARHICERLCMTIRGIGDQLPALGQREINGKLHYSDQYAIEDIVATGEGEDWITLHNTVLGYMDEGWEKAVAVHFSNAAMMPRGKTPRWKHIPTLLNS